MDSNYFFTVKPFTGELQPPENLRPAIHLQDIFLPFLILNICYQGQNVLLLVRSCLKYFYRNNISILGFARELDLASFI